MVLIAKNGLRFRSGPGRPLPLRPYPAGVPPFWRKIGVAGRTLVSERLLAQWALVLTARNIPFCLARRGARRCIYVPPLAEGPARFELEGYAAEPTRRFAPSAPPPIHGISPLIPFFLLLLLWHLACAPGGFTFFDCGLPQDCARLGALDVYRTRILHEWYRTVTALSLHADQTHLFGNLAAGGVFTALLCRRAGVGVGLLTAVAGGMLGNACNALYRPPSFTSLGFSSAVFAAVGALSGIQALREGRIARSKALLPLGAGAGLLAMLGTEGARTDYAAHLFGLAWGLLLGAAGQRLFPHVSSGAQTAAAAGVYGLFIVAWYAALR